MKEKKIQRRWGFGERFIRWRFIVIIMLGFALILSSPVSAATTSIHIVRYANDGTTILNETTKTYQWLEANLPVLGDGTTHYYSQGPTFNDSDLWDNAEWQNVDTRDWGAVKGTDLKNICNLVGGMSAGETIKIKASDGFSKTFPYEYVYTPNPRQGPMGITWYRADQGYVPGYTDGMRLVMFANAKTNTYGWNSSGWHVFGNADMRDCWGPGYWYNYSGIWPSSGGVSVKLVSDIIINSNQAPPVPPVASFTGTPLSGTAPLDVMFTDSSTGTSITNRRWDFGDGNISNYAVATSPSHRYSSAGTYSVNLTVTNSGGSNSILRSNYISVNAPPSAPVASFTGTPLSGTAPLDVIFTDSSTGTSITNRRWDFGDGNVSNYAIATNPSHRYSSLGVYTVTLTVTNAGGSNSQIRSNYITVIQTIPPGTLRIGVTNGQQWYLDTTGNGVWDAGSDFAYTFGSPGWTHVTGDWNNNGITKIGVTNGQQWYLDTTGNGIWEAGSDMTYTFGAAGWTPLVGNWNGDATGTKIGVYKDGSWYLDTDGSGTWNAGDRANTFGAAGWIPVTGDWNSDVTGTKIGVYKEGTWYLDWNGNGAWDSGTDKTYMFGSSGWVPIIGKWS
jgi:PKD repeat protein